MRFLSVKCLLFLTLTLMSSTLFAQDVVPKAADQTWSDYLHPIENDQAKKDLLFHQEMQLTNTTYSQSANRKFIEAALKKKFDFVSVKQEAILPGGQLQLIYNGLGKPEQILLKTVKESTVLFSNTQIKKNTTAHLTNFSVSPNQQFVLVFAELNGSIDDYQIIIIDLKSRTVISTNLINHGEGKGSVRWIGPAQFFFKSQNDQRLSAVIANDLTVATTQPTATYSGGYPYVVECLPEATTLINYNGAVVKRVILQNIKCGDWVEVLNANQKSIDILIEKTEPEQILSVARFSFGDDTASASSVELFNFKNQVSDSTNKFDGKYFFQTHWGVQSSLLIYDMADGSLVDQVNLPSYATVASVARGTQNTTVKIAMMSQVTSDFSSEYNYQTHAWVSSPDVNLNLRKNDQQYIDRVLQVPARDGTLIPVRLNYLATTSINENTPLLFKVYGGYGDSGGFLPVNEHVVRDMFIRHGGILVTAGPRGGNEYGEAWHRQAMGLKRMTTFFDVIDITKYLIAQKISSRNRIILTGTSAGGLVTLASGLLSPETFGLVIPISAPNDVLGKTRLDDRFFNLQKREYGDPDQLGVTEYMKLYSPLEQIADPKTAPQIFLIAGLNDSRVNVEHTLKMTAKLRQVGFADIQMNTLLIKNSGHWILNGTYQNLIGWRAEAVMWDRIYKFLNWSTKDF